MELSVRLADDDEVWRAWANNYESWGAPYLTLQEYVARERLLGATAFASQRSTWILTAAAAADDILSACETYPRLCLVSDGNGGLVTRKCVSIAAVYTPEAHRKKGYAAELLQRVLAEIQKDGSVVASTLYSEVGKLYYAKFGWKYSSSFVGTISTSSEPSRAWLQDSEFIHSTSIFSKDIPDIIKQDVLLLTSELKASSEPSFSVFPAADCIEWMNVCADYYARVYKHIPTPPLGRGARISDSDSFVLWGPDWTVNKLVIFRLRASNSTEVEALLAEALKEAVKNGLEKIIFWNPDIKNLFQTLYKKGVIEYHEREDEDSLSCVKFIGVDEKLNWVANEKFAWV
ncbi:hypothetical protein HK096_010943 [Nowakowskiella sp. JEL0078]|nr:hypothetical protein HK096_010943 [Nowakowskiella sp. JEL0078]